MNYRALDIQEKRERNRSFNARLIPAKLEELAKAGVYYESRIID